MPYQGKAPDKVVAWIAQNKGAMWTTITDPTNGGTGTGRTRIEQHSVPDAARILLGIRPVEIAADGAVAESQVAVFSIESGNYKFQPQEVICGCVSGPVLATGGLMPRLSEYFDVFAPVNGGEQIDVWEEPIDAIAGNRRASVEFTWANVRPPVPVIYSLCSREVASGTSVLAAAGTSLSITNAGTLIEIGAVCTQAALTVEEEMWASLKIKSTALDQVQETDILLEPQSAIVDSTADENSTVAGLARRGVWMPFKNKTATVTADFDMDVAVTAAGQFVHMIRWI